VRSRLIWSLYAGHGVGAGAVDPRESQAPDVEVEVEVVVGEVL
jgi:hypothetical protein